MAAEDEEESRFRTGLQSSCPICLLELRLHDKVSALNCGHVFHHRCVNQWLTAKRQCPSCRKVVPRSGFIEKLFFNVLDAEERNNALPQIDYEEETSRLTGELAAQKEKLKALEDDNKLLRITTKSLEKKILKEKDKTVKEIPRLEAMVENLKIVADEVPHFQREVINLKNKLKATEFYKVLNSYSEDAEKKLTEYLKHNGSLDYDKFFELLKAQNKELTDIRRQSRKTIEKLTDENSELRKAVEEKDFVIGTLKSNVLDLRDRANVKTPMNRRIQKVIDRIPSKRISMGFDETTLVDNDDVMKEFLGVQKDISSCNKKVESSVNLLDLDSDEEYFSVPKTVERKNVQSNASKSQESNDDFSFDIAVPPTIINRIPIAMENVPIFPLNKPNQNFKTLTSKPMHRSLTTPITIKPNVIKRKLSDDKLVKASVKPPAVKSARLSSFYKRIPSTSKGLNDMRDEFITLE